MPYDRYEPQRRRAGYGPSSRSTFGYWVPLALSVTVATIGLATWIWKERSDTDEYDDGRKGESHPPPSHGDLGPNRPTYESEVQPSSGPSQAYPQQDDETMVARMSGALRRTPSPQQIFDGARTRVAAGMAAAGAVVGGALSSIREEDRGHYEDHSRWSEEAEARNAAATVARRTSDPIASLPSVTPQVPSLQRSSDKRKAVAIVVSAEVRHDAENHGEMTYLSEHAASLKSILSHLPEHIDAESRVFIMIYSPDLKQHPLAVHATPAKPAPSIASSYSNIGQEDLHTPAEEAEKPLSNIDPRPVSSPNGSSDIFKALYGQARALVEKETMIMPFTTPTGYVQLLRHMAPEVVYVQAILSGPGGEAVKHISGWVGQVVLVVGDEGGHGGLVDSEDERGASGDDAQDSWWQDDARVGLGKGIEVVEGLRVGEDWRRRVRGHD